MDNDLDELTNLLDSDAFNEDDAKCSDQTLPDKTPPSKENNLSKNKKDSIIKFLETSEIHKGDTDSSDDEDNKYAAEQKYTETGRSIKKSLKKSTTESFYSQNHSWKTKQSQSTTQRTSTPANKIASKDIYSDPFFGIRIVTPLISSQTFKERMAGKVAVTFNKLENHLQSQDKTVDWVVAGVIVSKYIKTSQKGNPFACWTISDLREDLKTVSVFLFGKAYKDLWKTGTHVVVAILNPSPLDKRNGSGDIAALSVLNSDQVMVWGQSKDLGVCRARKKNGDPCTSFVNKSQCEYCVYHIKQEYKKMSSGRSELQSSWGGGRTQLRNKVLGKNEVFYAGQSFTAVVAKPSRKQVTKDKTRLSQLFNKSESRLGFDGMASAKPPPRTPTQRLKLLKDAQRLQSLTGSPATLESLTFGPDEQDLQNKKPASRISNKIRTPSHTHIDKSNSNKPSVAVNSHSSIASVKTNIGESINSKQSKSRLSQAVQKTPDIKLESTQESINSKSTPLSNKSKANPTKNRFDSLINLKGNFNNDKKLLTTKEEVAKPLNTKEVDVSFEFDESEDLMLCNALDELENSLNMTNAENPSTKKPAKQLNSLLPKNNLSKYSSKDISPNNTAQLRKSVSSSDINYKPEPLHEKKSPTKKESAMNTITTINKQTVKKLLPFAEGKHDGNGNTHDKIISTNPPKLTKFGSFSLGAPVRQSRAKENALKYIKLNGRITKEDPTNTKSKEISSADRKRKLVDTEEKEEKLTMSQRFIELMNTTSKHLDLITNADNEALEEYYNKMEKKEKMEEKMLNTFKIDCKAFKCLKCKYKWFSPSELCKAEKHPIKVVSAVKRFFQCQNCKNRTVSLEVIPLHNCSNCGNANWLRAAMMRERKPTIAHLSIRGGEQKFTNSIITDTNLDLLVPDN